MVCRLSASLFGVSSKRTANHEETSCKAACPTRSMTAAMSSTSTGLCEPPPPLRPFTCLAIAHDASIVALQGLLHHVCSTLLQHNIQQAAAQLPTLPPVGLVRVLLVRMIVVQRSSISCCTLMRTCSTVSLPYSLCRQPAAGFNPGSGPMCAGSRWPNKRSPPPLPCNCCNCCQNKININPSAAVLC